MRFAALLPLLLLAACSSESYGGSGSSLPSEAATVAGRCQNAGFMPGTAEYQRCYAAAAGRQDAGALGAMNLFRTIGPLGHR